MLSRKYKYLVVTSAENKFGIGVIVEDTLDDLTLQRHVYEKGLGHSDVLMDIPC